MKEVKDSSMLKSPFSTDQDKCNEILSDNLAESKLVFSSIRQYFKVFYEIEQNLMTFHDI